MSVTATSSSDSSSPSSSSLMKVIKLAKSQVAYPTGDPNFSVQQAFPAVISAEEADPFLMLDHFGPKKSSGEIHDPDRFPVQWHPHRGMDICTYMTKGVGRHADSMGNRGTFSTPGMQWISVGSGIEHAEAGGTPFGEDEEGFQIWINVPKKLKMADPRYGTSEEKDFPHIQKDGVFARVVAGELSSGEVGPFKTATELQIIDFTITKSTYTHTLPNTLNNCILYVHVGEGQVNNKKVVKGDVIHLDASSDAKSILLSSTNEMKILVFGGKRLNEPIAWRGPFVMNTQEELRAVMKEIHNGTFPPKRVPWNYKDLKSFPKEKLPSTSSH